VVCQRLAGEADPVKRLEWVFDVAAELGFDHEQMALASGAPMGGAHD
jgi:hypothetical protein